MLDLYFFLKTFILTIALILVLQMKIGNRSLEDRAVMAFKSSVIEEPLTAVAEGGAKLIRTTVKKIQDRIDGKKPEEKKSSGFRFNWSSQ
jgi:hypothetical protein